MRQQILQERPGWKMELERRLKEYRQRKRALQAVREVQEAAGNPAKAA